MPDQDPQPHSELATFGEELRREREIRGISLKEIADTTKISKRFLEAIERNDHKTLPAPVFTRGFVREYSRYLGLNAEDIVNRYNYAAAGDDRIEQSTHLDRLVPERNPERIAERLAAEKERKPVRLRGIPSPLARIDRNIYFAVVIAAVLAGVTYWAVAHRHASTSVEAELPREAVPHAAAVSTAATPAPQPPAPSPASADTLRLTMNFLDDSWMSVETDGNKTYSFDAKKGDKRTFEAKDRFRFKTIGNGAGVDFVLNDIHIAPLGREGQVLHDRVFDREYLQKAVRDGAASPPAAPVRP